MLRMWVLFFFHWWKFDLIYFMWVCLFFLDSLWILDELGSLGEMWRLCWMRIGSGAEWASSCHVLFEYDQGGYWYLGDWVLLLPCISSWSDPYPSLSFSLVGQPSNWWRSSPCKVWPHQSWNTKGLSRVRQDSFARSLCQFLWSIGELLLFPNEFASSLPFLSFVKVSKCFIFRLCPMEVEVLYLAMWVVLMLCL